MDTLKTRTAFALPTVAIIMGIGIPFSFVFSILLMLGVSFFVFYRYNKLPLTKNSGVIGLKSILISILFFLLGLLLSNEFSTNSETILVNKKIKVDSLYVMCNEGVHYSAYGAWSVGEAFSLKNSFSVLLNCDSVVAKDIEKGDTLFFSSIKIYPIQVDSLHFSSWNSYLKKQGVYVKCYANTQTKVLKNKSWSYLLYRMAHQKIKNSILSANAKSLLLSLLLGDRGYIDKETKNKYAVLGVSHILSVSGLHVGIIYVVISFVISLFVNKQSYFSVVVVLFLIWFYCWMVGFSPPVVRSALMFSVYVCGEALGRSNNLWHATCVSAFVILLINPEALYDISFQLSYGAILGIVFILPLFSSYLNVKNKILKLFTELIAVSIAVQITLLPLLVYHFGNLSTYFIVGNLLMVPLVAVLMYLGLCFLLLFKEWSAPIYLCKAINAIVNFSDVFCTLTSQWSYAVVYVENKEFYYWGIYGMSVSFGLMYFLKRMNAFLYLSAVLALFLLLF